MTSSAIHLAIKECDDLRAMLNYISDGEKLEEIQHKLLDNVAECFKHQQEILTAYINTTNEFHEYIELSGKNIRINKVRQILKETDIKYSEIITQLDWMLKFIDSQLAQCNAVKVAEISKYENNLLDLQQSLNQYNFHNKNCESASLVRKIRGQVSSLIEKINSLEKKLPENYTNVINQAISNSVDGDNDEVIYNETDNNIENIFD